MSSKIKSSALTFLSALALALTAQAPAQAAGCTQAPIVEILTVEPDRIQVRFDERCTGEEFSKLWARDLTGGWSRLITNLGDASGWRSAWDEGLEPGGEYCYQGESRKDATYRTSPVLCATTPLPKVKLGLIKSASGTNLTSCSSIPSSPKEAEKREHVFITDALAAELGITVPTGTGPKPQIRLTVDSPLMDNDARSSANYTVVRTCPGTGPFDWRLWMENANKLVLPANTVLSNVTVTLQTVAPSRTTWTDNGSPAIVENHFTEPNTGQKFFREKVAMVDNKEVALLVPHGGGIERSTSVQAQTFLSEIGVAVNVWENEGQWGDEQTFNRWHITAPDIHEASFPGLARLLAEPAFNSTQNQDFRYAVALHGFDDKTGVGLILGGLAPADVLCHVAHTIQDEAGTRANEIGFHIANAGTNGADIRIENVRKYTPSPADLEDLEGTGPNNIVNRVSRAQANPVTWGGIQLEQSLPLRREMDYRFADFNNDGVNDFCTSEGPNCLHNVVARGVARAVAELVDDVNPVNPAGACCTHFGHRCQ